MNSKPSTPRTSTRAFDFDVLDAIEAKCTGKPASVSVRAAGATGETLREAAARPPAAWEPPSSNARPRSTAVGVQEHASRAEFEDETTTAEADAHTERRRHSPPFCCITVGEPWVPIRQQPGRYSRLVGAVSPGDAVTFCEVKAHYGWHEKVDKQGRTISGWSPLEERCFKSLDPGIEIDDMLECDTVHEDWPRSLGYGDGVVYWDQRYKEDLETFDWIGLGLSEIAEVLDKATGSRRDCRIMHVGCGTSLLPEQLYDAGYTRIVNTDIAPQVIQQMRHRNMGGKRPGMIFRVADATNLVDFHSGRFDLVLDKAVLDTFACCERRGLVIGDYLAEASRVLAPGGVLLVLSSALPEMRVPFVAMAPHCDFDVEVVRLALPSGKAACAMLARRGRGGALADWRQLRAVMEAGGPPWWGNE